MLLRGHKVRKMVKFCVMAGAGLEFSLQAALAPGRLKPELQTAGVQRMAERHEGHSLFLVGGGGCRVLELGAAGDVPQKLALLIPGGLHAAWTE